MVCAYKWIMDERSRLRIFKFGFASHKNLFLRETRFKNSSQFKHCMRDVEFHELERWARLIGNWEDVLAYRGALKRTGCLYFSGEETACFLHAEVYDVNKKTYVLIGNNINFRMF